VILGATRHWLLAAVLVTAAVFFLNSLWIPAKAELAQFLMERAWDRAQNGALDARPWPWADTSPVAVLEIPSLDLRQLVLEGASGRNLAFGPATVTPIDSRDLVVSGHRDTHFSPLRDLQPGDRILLTRRSGMMVYRVAWLDVVDSRSQEIVLEPRRDRLTLVTCYPFDAVEPGGTLRLVVTALPEIQGTGP
jgi:sortase A